MKSYWVNLPEICFTPKETSSHGCLHQPWFTNGLGWAGDAGTHSYSPSLRHWAELLLPTGQQRERLFSEWLVSYRKVKRAKNLRGCASPAVNYIWRQECSKSMFSANKLSKSDREVSATWSTHLTFCHFPDDLVLPKAFCRRVKLSLIPVKDAKWNTNFWKVRLL